MTKPSITLCFLLGFILFTFNAIAATVWELDDAASQAYTAKDYKTAFKNWSSAAAQGDAEAQDRLGFLYSNGQGMPQDYKEAAKWYSKAAEQGNTDALYALGEMYSDGKGVPQDDAKAFTLYRKLAEKGDMFAQLAIGYAYIGGIGVKQDYSQAMVWFNKSAAQGNASAQYEIADMYDNGKGVPKDHAQAVTWYRKSAEKGDAEAQYDLALAYLDGSGVPQDYVQAVKWFREAAYLPYPRAEVALGTLYFAGEGVQQDFIVGYALFNMAASSAKDSIVLSTAAQLRSKIMNSMTPAQVEAGQALTREMQRVGIAKAMDAYLNSDTQLVQSNSDMHASPTQPNNSQNEDYYLKQVLGPNGHIDKALHDQFWQQFNGESEHDVTLAINWFKGSILVAQEFEKELWKSALLSYNVHQVVKTERLIQLEKEVPEMAKKSLPWPPGTPQYTEALASFNSGWTSTIEDAKRLLDAAAKHKPFIAVNGEVRQIDKHTIEQASSSINASVTRLTKLLDRNWNDN